MIREGGKQTIEVPSVQRKKSNKHGVPGIVITKFKSKEDKQRVMDNKNKLSKSANHSKVKAYILLVSGFIM